MAIAKAGFDWVPVCPATEAEQGTAMFLTDVTNRGAVPALISTMAFNEARLEVISDNIANATTPGYKARQLDPRLFQQSLREALDRRELPQDRFYLNDNGQSGTGRSGLLETHPALSPVDNILFHDGTNVSIEREMVDLAETAMAHEMAAEMLAGGFNAMRKAIRGTL
ncbi:MAG: flagellar basal body rod protein FlgB [Planctomycetota bacterium]